MKAHKALSVALSLLLATSLCPGMTPLALAEEETPQQAAEPSNAEVDGFEGSCGALQDAVPTNAASAGAPVGLPSDASEEVAARGVDALEASVDTVAEESVGEEGETSVGDTSWYSQDTTSFTITTAEQLVGLSVLSSEGETFAGKTITLGADVGLSGYLTVAGLVWTPIGSAATPFSGVFDGTGHMIGGIATTSANDNQGLFGVIKGAHISNLTVEGTVTGKANSGGIAGQVQGDANTLSSVTNCVNRASVSGTGNYAGGIVGSAGWVTIQGCVNVGSVSGNRYVGEELGTVVDGNGRALEVGLVACDYGLDVQLLGALVEAGILEVGPRRFQRVLDVVLPQRADARQPLHFQQAKLH